MPRIKIALIPLIIVLSLQFKIQVLAEDIVGPLEIEKNWKTIESKYCCIVCHPDVDVEKLNEKIEIRFYDIDWTRYSSKNRSVEEQLAEKIDCIFRKVEKILDMYPRKIHLMVKIYSSQAQLDDAYVQIFGYADGKQRTSYYVHKYTTVYTTEQVISQNVLAHELGHAVVDHYFLILPPEKIKELLSQYVENHLED